MIKIFIPVHNSLQYKYSNYGLTLINDSGFPRSMTNSFMKNNVNNEDINLTSPINSRNNNIYINNPFISNNNYNNVNNDNNDNDSENNDSSQYKNSTLINNKPFLIDKNNRIFNTLPNIFNSNKDNYSHNYNDYNINNNEIKIADSFYKNMLSNNNNRGSSNTDNNLNSYSKPIINRHRSQTSLVVEYEKIINILCLDDDQIFLGMLSKHLKFLAQEFPRIKFDFILTSTFQEFFNEFISLTTRNIIIDFFIMDQNISNSLKGVDCCRLVNEFYKTCFKERYDKLNFFLFFVTEESNLHKFTIKKNEVNLIKKDQIFSKMQFKKLYEKLIQTIAAAF